MSRESRRKISVVGLALALALVPAVALGFHGEGGFEDVPESHLFHDDIAWMHDTGVTRGCNPPENDEYCPERALTRGEEAAFFHRYDGYLRDSLAPSLLPEDCEAGQVAQFDGENWVCADGLVGLDLYVASGGPVAIAAGETGTATASCEPGDTALGGNVSSASTDLEVGIEISDGEVTATVTNNGGEEATVTAHAICNTTA